MNKKHLGTKYGGWTIDIDSISDNDFIIDGGLGEDISFGVELSKLKQIFIIGVDPTPKSHKFIKDNPVSNLTLVKKAITSTDGDTIKIYKNSNPDWVSESTFSDHANVNQNEYHTVETISLKTLIEEYNPSLVKLDIEGNEYGVLDDCIGVKQICVEFHHTQINGKNINDTNKEIEKLKSNGYKVIHTTPNFQEVTFLKQ